MTFQPKQVITYTAQDLAELQGDVTEQIIDYWLDLLGPFQDGDLIHDNACGAGAVTNLIMDRRPTAAIHIDATDINPLFVSGVAAAAQEKQWPVSTAAMPAQKLDFADGRFTHSLTNFAFHCIGDDRLAAKEVYRTLRPGGTAVASIWTSMPVVDLVHHAHWLTRGREGPLPKLVPLDLFTEADLRGTFEHGGFRADQISCQYREVLRVVGDPRRFAELTWGYLAPLPGGWAREDEERWEEAVENMVEQIERTAATNDKGERVLKMVACIAVAKK